MGVLSIYWDIAKVLAYQRNFNLINGPRSIGKTYTTLKYFIKRWKNFGEEFVYLCRTQQEKKAGILESSMRKVLIKEYRDLDVQFTSELGKVNQIPMCWCYALTEAAKMKPLSFPRVKWLIFDEYMLEEGVGNRYINGWDEPNSLLSIYQTIDRDEDRLTCFLLGNNTSFYNPYHMHPAFRIPVIKKGGIWTSENVLYQWAVPSDELQEQKSKTRFARMTDGSEYGRYATQGEFILDNYAQVKLRPVTAVCQCVIKFGPANFGIWYEPTNGECYFSDRYNASLRFKYAGTVDDIETGWPSFRNSSFFAFYQQTFLAGRFYFETMEIKKKCYPFVESFIGRR